MTMTPEQKARLLAARDRLRPSKSVFVPNRAPVTSAEITASRILDRIKANHGIKD